MPDPDEPVNKRRKFDVEHPPSDDFLPPFLPTPTTENHPASGIALDQFPVDPFLSPATSWGFDEFAHDPTYLASQEELRCLLFNTAKSAGPTRPGTPIDEIGDEHESRDMDFNLKTVLSKGRRVQYLKNYISQVAPWVCIVQYFPCRS